MAQPMLAIKPSRTAHPQTTPHLLPCRVNYDGPVEPSQAYWSPSQNADGTKIAYFRGRKLAGKAVKVPEGYRGVVVEKQAPGPKTALDPMAQEETEKQEVPLGSLETRAEFDEFVIWGHETTADAESDPYARMEEWIGVAETIHSYPAVEKGS